MNNTGRGFYHRAGALVALIAIITAASMRLKADTGTCGGQMITLPFTDVPSGNTFFCSIAEAFFAGLSNGTSATTYNPSDPVPREQMAAFVTRTMDQAVKRSSKRAALNQYWTTQNPNLGLTTTTGSQSKLVQSDGADIWIANPLGTTVDRIRASDGRRLAPWAAPTNSWGVLCAMGKVFVTGTTDPGSLYQIDPTQPAGAVTTVSSALGPFPRGIAYDGQRIWVANYGSPGSVSIITLNPTTVNTVTTGFGQPYGVIYDGTNIWVIDGSTTPGTLRKTNSSGNILLSVDVGIGPSFPAFDGTNIWVPNVTSNTVSVVRATGGLSGTVLATLSGNGLNNPTSAAFDGERILVTNFSGSSVSLWKATDFTPIGTFPTPVGTNPFGACSDGLNFWISLTIQALPSKLARF